MGRRGDSLEYKIGKTERTEKEGRERERARYRWLLPVQREGRPSASFFFPDEGQEKRVYMFLCLLMFFHTQKVHEVKHVSLVWERDAVCQVWQRYLLSSRKLHKHTYPEEKE